MSSIGIDAYVVFNYGLSTNIQLCFVISDTTSGTSISSSSLSNAFNLTIYLKSTYFSCYGKRS